MNKLMVALFVFIVSTQINAQVFVGSGYAQVDFYGPSALDGGAGFSLMIEKDINLSKSTRWKIHPNFNVGFLFWNYDRVIYPNYFNVFSFSPKVSYELISNKKFKMAPYGNPFASFLLGIHHPDFFGESEPLNEFKSGFEIGFRVDLTLGKTVVRVVPIASQLGQGIYRQAMVYLMIEW